MKIIKRSHYTRGRKDGFMVGVNLNTLDYPQYNSTVFIGWSLCDKHDEFNKLFGTKTAVIRALKTAKLFISNINANIDAEQLVIGDAGFGGGTTYECEKYINDNGTIVGVGNYVSYYL